MAETTRAVNADGTTTVTTKHDDGTETVVIEAAAKPKKVTFDEEQQAAVNRMIDSAFGKAFEKASAGFESKLAESQTKITELTSKLEAVKTAPPPEPKKKDEKPNEELAQAVARIAELTAAHQALVADKDKTAAELAKQKSTTKETAIERAFLNGSRKIKFINPDQVLKLIRDEIDFDDELGQVVVKNLQTGRPRMDDTFENPLSVEAFLSKWAEANKNHVEATDAGGGTGAEGSRRTPPTTFGAKTVDQMTPAEFDLYKESIRMKSTR